MEEMLLDDWSVNGNDENVLHDTISDLSAKTSIIVLRTNQFHIITVRERAANGDLICYVHKGKATIRRSYTADELAKAGATEKIIEELLSKSLLLFEVNNELYFSAVPVLITLAQRAGSGVGDFTWRKEVQLRYYRNAGYAAYMDIEPSICKMLYRVNGAQKKVFAIYSERYVIQRQDQVLNSFISTVNREIGKCTIKEFHINHFYTIIRMEFEGKAFMNLPEPVYPGVELRMSDTGHSSNVAIGTIRIGKSLCYLKHMKVVHVHKKRTRTKDEIGEAFVAKCREFMNIEERLNDLCQITISDPVCCVSKVASAIGINHLQKEMVVKAVNCIKDRLNDMTSCTAYDVAASFLKIPEISNAEEMISDISLKERLISQFPDAIWYHYA